LCFAVAINAAKWVVTQLFTHGRVRRAFIGLAGATAPLARRAARFLGTEQGSAVRVSDVQAGSPAAAGGLRVGDFIVGLDGLPVSTVDDLLRLLDESRIGKLCVVRVLRGAQALYLNIQPREVPAAARG
jgi:S1-C subfamily serine protease